MSLKGIEESLFRRTQSRQAPHPADHQHNPAMPQFHQCPRHFRHHRRLVRSGICDPHAAPPPEQRESRLVLRGEPFQHLT